MSYLHEFVGKYVIVELSGHKYFKGHLLEYGLDMLVVNPEQTDSVYYIPLVHVQSIHAPMGGGEAGPSIQHHPFDADNETISLRKVLMHARGHFVEIYVSGKTTIHGYLTSVMNDYFVFHSPVYKTIFVNIEHLKWLMPYPDEVTPYALDADSLPHYSTPTSLARTYKDLCKKLEGKMVVFDMGDDPNRIGQLKSVDLNTNMAELFTANGTKHLLNMHHLKTVYVP
jgi:small nuclear ribonucleoprotein (snRNP)-like protein